MNAAQNMTGYGEKGFEGLAASLFDLTGKVAVITGAGSGIGAATARMLASAGAAVVATDQDADAAGTIAEALREAGAKAHTYALDVADPDAVEEVFSALAREVGAPAILVNNAGVAIRNSAFELTAADWDRVFEVNVKGMFLCSRAAARFMVEAKSGSIVNLASIMGLSGGGLYPNSSYQASKGAVVNLTRALAVEWAGAGVRVNAVAPTWVRTPFIARLLEDAEKMERINAMTPLGRIAEPEEVAAAILFLASPASSMTTGEILAVDGGYLAQ